jgi:hypothetical protein
MILTPTYVTTLLNAAAMDQRYGIIRGCSPHVDCFPQHELSSPLPIRHYGDVCAFSEYVSRYCGLHVDEDSYLIGDSFLVRRPVLDKIGVMDTAYRHLLGDIDFSLRCRRAGFKVVCAKGAWLYHAEGAHSRDRVRGGASEERVAAELMQLSSASRVIFRSRWGVDFVPGEFAPISDFDRLAAEPPRPSEYVPPLTVDPGICEVV